jgi:poly-gamma-glutamate synthesis protein (capsule biosynthesis protein)
MIVILPFGNWIANQNQFDEQSWANVFVQELMPMIETRYRVDTRPTHRAIGGISRGGFWAYQIALSHLALFGAIGGHSAFFDRFHALPEHNPLDLALTLTPATAPRLWLDRGGEDYAAPGLDLMHSRLDSIDVPHEYRVASVGQHNNDYWASQLNAYLDFYAQPWLSASIDPTLTPSPTFTPSVEARWVLLPAVAFPSIRVNLTRDFFDRVLTGEYDPTLVLSDDAVLALLERGIVVNSQTQIVQSEALDTLLWADRDRWTILPFDQLTPRYRVLWIEEQNPLYQLADYPLAFQSDTPNFDPARLTRVMLSGVTAMTRRSMPILDERGVNWATEAIAPYTTRADFFHTSNEVSFVETCPQAPPNEVTFGGFCSKPAYFEALTLMGVDVIELSGNHNNDYGYTAYQTTLEAYTAEGMQVIGGGSTVAQAQAPLRLEHHGNTIAWVSCNDVGPYYAWANDDPNLLGGVRPGAAECSSSWLEPTLAQLQRETDLVILTVQYLESDQYVPLPAQRADFRAWAEMGADLVIGTQAHWPQTYDFTATSGGRVAFLHYGMGNFIFDQPWWANSRFFMNELYIYDGRLQFVDVYTGIIEDLARPRLMTPEEREIFLQVMFIQNGGL